MKRLLAVLLEFSCLIPAVAWSQSMQISGEIPDSASLILAVTKANRAGIAVPLTSSSDTTTADRTRADRVTDRIVHTLVGGFLGTVGGGAAGAEIGAYIDSHHRGDGDAMIPGAVILGIYGAISGLALGLIVGLLWPVH
jgi:hypothetical protein